MRVNGKLCREFAIAKNLYAIAAAANEPVRAQQLWRYRFAGRKDVQFRKVQNRILDAERVVKAALGMRRCSGIWPPSNPRRRE